MLDRLFARFREKEETEADPEQDLRLAVACLLVEAARADEVYKDEERRLIGNMLAKQFSLDAGATDQLLEDAEAAQAAANDLYGFSSVVKQGLDQEGKMKLVEDMWVIALSDREKAPYEEMVIRRLIGLIHLEDTASTLARRRAADRLGHDKA